jgi:hypothetical protein
MSQDEAEALLLPKYKEAMTYGVEALRSWQQSENTEDADVPVGGAADAPPPGLGPEDNNALLGHPHLVSAKNEYMKRPLPFVIGTRQFAEDEYAGLRFDVDADLAFLEDDRASHDDAVDDSIKDGLSSDDEDADFYSSDEEGAPPAPPPPMGPNGIPVPPPPPPKGKKQKEKQSYESGDDADDADENGDDADAKSDADSLPSPRASDDEEAAPADADEDKPVDDDAEEENAEPKQPPRGTQPSSVSLPPSY